MVRNGQDKAEILARELKDKVPDVSASVIANKKILHIKNMYELTTEEDICAAISKATAVQPDKIAVKTLQPAYGNKQNATLILNDA